MEDINQYRYITHKNKKDMIYKGYIIHYCFCGYETKMYLINFPNIPTFPKNIKYAHKTVKEAKREIDRVIGILTQK